MSALATALEEYLALRRSLGYKLERTAGLLADFVASLDEVGADHITVELAMDWAMRAANPDSPWRAQRLGMVRCLARYLHATDPRHEVPPPGLVPRGRRPEPFIYAEADIVALMAAARRMRSPLRALTMETLIGLLAVTGLRVGEVIRLDRHDVDLEEQLLVVRNTKLGRSRHVPLHASTTEVLRSYLLRRDLLLARPPSPALFVSTTGTRLRPANLRAAFMELHGQAGLPRREGRRGYRLGDLRHSFAVQALLDWHLAEVDVGPRLPVLSTYLGHVSPVSTYWYLSAHRRCWRLPLSAWRTEGGCRHDDLGAHPRGVLHPATRLPAPGLPPHHRRLSRHVPAATRLRAGKTRDTSSQARPRGPRCTPRRRLPRSP